MARHNNVFLSDTAETYGFSSTPKPGRELQIPFRENRKSHSDKLVAQFREAQNYFNSYTPEQVAAISYNTGTYVEFVGAENCDLLTKSLEDSRQGIKLLNVRDVVSEYDKYHNPIITTKATVFIPTGKEDVFISKIKDFATELTKSGKPKNNDLVSSIESISDAIKISSFWVGRPTEMPDKTKRWYELWVDVDEKRFDKILQNTFSALNALNLVHRQETEYIRFPERLVLPVFANRSELLSLIKQGVTIAEIRKPAEPNAFFLDSSVNEQTEWANDLLFRTQFNDSGVTVCILDTGVNNNHKLITPYMPTLGATVNRSWGTQDKDGHGTNMAGVILYNDLKRYLITNTPYELNHTIESIKILEPSSPTPTNITLYGFITEQAALLSEISNPTAKRIYCMAITDPTSSSNDGQPSSWSAAIDKISTEGQKRLFIISAGNVEEEDLKNSGYPNACLNKSIEDPAQAWNALTVGAYSIDSTIQPRRETE
jgi:subtilisin family serine protease